MTISQIIAGVSALKPHAFSNEQLTLWLSEAEGICCSEVMLLDPADIPVYTYAANAGDEPLVAPPHDKLYRSYLLAMIDFANGEFARYDNTVQLFNTHLAEYTRWYTARYRPADGACEAAGYYLSAYAIAVKHGFTGSEAEWLGTLHMQYGDLTQDEKTSLAEAVAAEISPSLDALTTVAEAAQTDTFPIYSTAAGARRALTTAALFSQIEASLAPTYTPSARTVNGHALTADVSLTPADIGTLGTDAIQTAVSGAVTAHADAPSAHSDLFAARVPSARTVNGHALTADVSLTPADIGTLGTDAIQTAVSGAVTAHTDAPSAHSDLFAARVPLSRTVNGHALTGDVSLTPADIGAAASTALSSLEAAALAPGKDRWELINTVTATADVVSITCNKDSSNADFLLRRALLIFSVTPGIDTNAVTGIACLCSPVRTYILNAMFRTLLCTDGIGGSNNDAIVFRVDYDGQIADSATSTRTFMRPLPSDGDDLITVHTHMKTVSATAEALGGIASVGVQSINAGTGRIGVGSCLRIYGVRV